MSTSPSTTSASPVRRSQRSRISVKESYYQQAQRELKQSLESSKSSSTSRSLKKDQKQKGTTTRSSANGLKSRLSSSKSSKPLKVTVQDDKFDSDEHVEKGEDENVEQEEGDEQIMQSFDEADDDDDASSDDDEFIRSMIERKKRLSKAKKNHPVVNRKTRIKTVEANVETKPTLSKKSAPQQNRGALMNIAKKVLNEKEDPSSSLVASLLRSSTVSGGKNKISPHSAIECIARRTAGQLLSEPMRSHVDLMNMIFRSVGCKYENLLTYDMDLDDMPDDELALIVEQVVDDMAKTPADAILLCADPNGPVSGKSSRTKDAAKEYREIFEKFWYELGSAIVSDGYDTKDNQVSVAQELITRLVEMVWIGVPDIRAAFTMAVYQLAASLLQCTAQWQNKLSVAQRQYHSAKRVNSSSTSQKAKALQQQVEFLKQSIEAVEELVKEHVMGVFLKRYRDKNEHIRVESLRALSSFTLIRPDIFLNGIHLKYFGWMLSDKDARVRKSSVMGLLAPFSHNERFIDTDSDERIDTSGMKSVIQKFLTRIADCVHDVDAEVQITAMELALQLVRNNFFDDVDDDQIWKQLNLQAINPAADKLVRRNALYFVMEQLPQFDNGSSDNDNEAVQRIKALVEWISNVISDGDVPLERINYKLVNLVVGSLRTMPEHTSLVSNWNAILRALQGDNRAGRKSIGKGGQRNEAVQQRVLLNWLVTSAEMEVYSLRVSAEDDPKKNPMLQDIDKDYLEIQAKKRESVTAHIIDTKKQKMIRTSTSHEELTLALMKTLPDLLASFKSETPILRSLLLLPRYLLPSVFNLSSRKKDFHDLISTLSKIFVEVTDEQVLNNCALSLISLTRGEHARKDEALLVLKQTASSLRSRLSDLLDENAVASSNTPKSEESDLEPFNDTKVSQLESEQSLFLCLRRLRILSKRWYLPELLMNQSESHEDDDEQLESLFTAVAQNSYKQLSERQLIVSEENMEDVEVPKIWSMQDEQLHSVVAESISESLDLLLSLTAWKVLAVVDMVKNNPAAINEEEGFDDHIVLRMRNHLFKLAVLCYEQFVESEYIDKVSESQRKFSIYVQEKAGRLTGDLRTLFPKQWATAKSKLLASLALTQEVHLVGGLVRFVRSQDDRLRACASVDTDNMVVYDLLLPLARGLAGNWMYGNRKEAGVALSHIFGSGAVAQELVQSLSRVCKKINPVRMLESHMAYLRQDFTDWKESQPRDIESDRPTDADLAEFDDAVRLHKAKFEAIENRAMRLSSSLGVGTIRNNVLASALVGFIREGIRYAFSTAPEGTDEEVSLGDRLTFLLPLSKYLNWIRRNKAAKDSAAADLNKRESELRNDPDYDQICDEDKAAIEAFRKAGDFGHFVAISTIDDETTVARDSPQTATGSRVYTEASFSAQTDVESATNNIGVDETAAEKKRKVPASSASVARSGGSSIASTNRSKFSSSQSLSPLPEEEDEGDENNKDDRKLATQEEASMSRENKDDISQLSPSPRPKRRRLGKN